MQASVIGLIVAPEFLIVLRPFYWPEPPRLIALGLPAAGLVLGVLVQELTGIAVNSKRVDFIAKCTYATYATGS